MCDNKEQCVVTKSALLAGVILTTTLHCSAFFPLLPHSSVSGSMSLVTHFHLLPSCSSSAPCVKSFTVALSITAENLWEWEAPASVHSAVCACRSTSRHPHFFHGFLKFEKRHPRGLLKVEGRR